MNLPSTENTRLDVEFNFDFRYSKEHINRHSLIRISIMLANKLLVINYDSDDVSHIPRQGLASRKVEQKNNMVRLNSGNYRIFEPSE